MSDQPDYYEILQVHPKASPLMIKKAYRTLMIAGGHPDHGGSKGNAQLLTEAYETLNDPDRRLAYDRSRGVIKAVPAALIISICPHCGVYNRVRTETKLLIARCGKCGNPLGKLKPPTAPLKQMARRYTWQWVAAGAAFFIVGASLLGYKVWNDNRNPLQEAIELQERGQLSSAYEKLSTLLAADSKNLMAHERLAEVLEEMKKPDQAIAEYERVRDLAPKSPKSHYLLGKALLHAGRYPDAERALRQSLEIDAQDVGSLMVLANLLVRTERTEEAIALYRRAIPLDTNNSDLYFNLGTAYQLHDDVNEAISAYRQALGVDPRNRDALVRLGKLYQDRGAMHEALTHFQRASIIQNTDADLHFRMGEVHRQLNDLGNAIREYRTARTQAKGNPIMIERCDQALRALGG